MVPFKERTIEHVGYGVDLGALVAHAGRYSWLAALLVAMVVTVKGTILESFYVPSVSMAPTLESDDCIVVPKLAYGLHVPFLRDSLISWSQPERGQVIVFNRSDDPSTWTDEGARSMVKRVIGLSGDRIRITGSVVSVNDTEIQESYARWIKGGSTQDQSFVVPEDSLFVLGDNRDDSYDSRFWSNPFIKTSQVVGPVSAVYWSPSQPSRAGTWVQ
jgi:signal peptidase I